MTEQSLFPEPNKQDIGLSGTFNTVEYNRSSAIRAPAWRRFTSSHPPDCDECFSLQHITNGKFHPRRQATWCRTLKRREGATHLYLCNGHAYLWRLKDKG